MMAKCADDGASRARARETPVYDILACRSTAWLTHKSIIPRDPSNRQEKFGQEFSFSALHMNCKALSRVGACEGDSANQCRHPNGSRDRRARRFLRRENP